MWRPHRSVLQARGRPVAHMSTRIPSWLHMPGMGLPMVASWGDNLAGACDDKVR